MALERDPYLLEYAFEKNIILTFPTSLLAILKGFSMTIQKAEMTKNINEIQQMSSELYKRFLNFVEKFSELGSNISKLNKSYNAAQGSYKKGCYLKQNVLLNYQDKILNSMLQMK